jgi:hypothetical protein
LWYWHQDASFILPKCRSISLSELCPSLEQRRRLQRTKLAQRKDDAGGWRHALLCEGRVQELALKEMSLLCCILPRIMMDYQGEGFSLRAR